MRVAVFRTNRAVLRIAVAPSTVVVEEHEGQFTNHIRIRLLYLDASYPLDCTFDEAVAELNAALRDELDFDDDDGYDPLGLADGLDDGA